MYRNDWHDRHRAKTRESADKIAAHLKKFFAIESVLDVGCGHGDWLKAFGDLGVPDLFGCDGPWNDVESLRITKSQYAVADFRQPVAFPRIFDLVMSAEVAEHVDGQYARQFVRSLVAHGDLVLFGAAIPSQGGFRHVNEQWPSWWAQLFRDAGYVAFDLVRPVMWDEPEVHFWYKQNMLVYVKESRDDLMSAAKKARAELATSNFTMDVVHPEKFAATASYREVAFKPFLKNFPLALSSKLAAMLPGKVKG